MSVFDRWTSAVPVAERVRLTEDMAGYRLPEALKTMRQALIVVDVQESFRRRPYFREQDLPAFLRNVQSLINRCQDRGIPIAQVFHQEPGDDVDNPFSAASGWVRTMRELTLPAAAVFHKSVHSAMFARSTEGATLEDWLRQRGIGELLICGIRTEQCCETTTRHASDLGFAVRYVTDATLTFPMRTRAGREVSAAEIQERTEMVLDGRFAQVVTTAGALS
jgi:nicotinamidase-related amidase